MVAFRAGEGREAPAAEPRANIQYCCRDSPTSEAYIAVNAQQGEGVGGDRCI